MLSTIPEVQCAPRNVFPFKPVSRVDGVKDAGSKGTWYLPTGCVSTVSDTHVCLA